MFNRESALNIKDLKNIDSKKKLNSTGIPLRSFEIDKTELKKRNKEKMTFSFELFERNHEAFNLGGVDNSWFIGLLDALKDISELTWVQVTTEKKGRYDPHTHNWKQTNYKFAFDKETLEQNEGWQFRLSKSKGRVHGFVIGNVFYIYWLDPHHNMYDSEGYGGIKKYSRGFSEYEILTQKNQDLIDDNKKLKEDIEIYEELLKV